jgi:hypothetical protein
MGTNLADKKEDIPEVPDRGESLSLMTPMLIGEDSHGNLDAARSAAQSHPSLG